MQIVPLQSERSAPEAQWVGLAAAQTPPPVQPLQGGEETKRDRMELGNIGRAVFGVGRIYIYPGFLRTFSFPQHPHDILSNIHADGTAKGMIIKVILPCVIVHLKHSSNNSTCDQYLRSRNSREYPS